MLKAVPLTVAMVMALCLTVACDFARSNSEKQVAEGVGLLSGGRHADAVRIFEAATATDDSNPNAWYYLGYTRSRALSNAQGAIEPLQRAADLDPQRADATYELGYALENAGQRAEAIGAYQATALRDPNHVGALYRLGQLFESTGEFRSAIDAYSRCIHADPFFPLAWSQLGNLYAEFGATDAAIKVFSNGIENNPESKELRSSMGIAMFEAGRIPESIQALEGAIEAGDSSTATSMTLGMAYLRRSEMSGAAADRKAAQEQLSRASRTCNPSVDGARCNVIATKLHSLERP